MDAGALASSAIIQVGSTASAASTHTTGTFTSSDAGLVGQGGPGQPLSKTPGASILHTVSEQGLEVLRAISKHRGAILHKLAWVGATVVFGLMGGTMM